jgi:Fe(3+) dicitrate transport protein
MEIMTEIDILRLFFGQRYKSSISYYVNTSFNNSEYVKGSFKHKKVEHVPNTTLRTGVAYKKGNFSVNIQYSYVAQQYTDAYNTEKSSNAIVGAIPAYFVFDMSTKYQYKRYYFAFTLNNFTNNKYFTRRADSYPGPGIIPSDPIQGYATIGVKF